MTDNKYKKSPDSWCRPMTREEVFKSINDFAKRNIDYKKDKVIGFPGTTPEEISLSVYNKYLRQHSNNIGLHTINGEHESGFEGTQAAEKEVVAMVADLMGATPSEVDGYIASGGTEANIVACWIGRNRAKHPKKSAIICSQLTHYSVAKAANLLDINIEIVCSSNVTGRTDALHMYDTINKLIKEKVLNFIVIGNAGSTTLGSVDNIDLMNQALGLVKVENPDVNIHFHIDAAFGGFIVPFLDHIPKVGFTNQHVDSITIDVHKMGLAPYGSGIILTRKGLFQNIKTQAPYIPGNDYTLCGSRSGAIALSCWAVMKHLGKEGYKKNALRLTWLASEINKKLRKNDVNTFNNDLNIVAIKEPLPEKIRKKYITHFHKNFPANLLDPKNTETIPVWNIVVMNHTTFKIIDELIDDLCCHC